MDSQWGRCDIIAATALQKQALDRHRKHALHVAAESGQARYMSHAAGPNEPAVAASSEAGRDFERGSWWLMGCV